MKPSSAKQKGRLLQQKVRDVVLEKFPHLEADDVRSTSMGAGGADVQLSPAAKKVFPFDVECKSLAAVGIYKHYKQATTHGRHEPLVVVKQNNSKPLAVVDLEYFVDLVRRANV
jgi:hypothetical protein